MGIQGLLPALKSIITPVHVRSYAGKKAAIDTYSWLHKAAYSCCKDLCEGRPTNKLIEYCMHRINLLRHYGVQPVMVFDGGVLPMKADQEAKRARSRKEHSERALDHERLGNRSAAFECYSRAVDITPAMAARLIEVLKREGVQYVVAPYEADAQMAYLANHGLVDVIITEDSDLIAYGCPRVFFKMDKSGQGEEFQFGDLVRNKGLEFVNFTKDMVLEMCVMTGCDYLPSLPGMGIKKAHGYMRRFKSYQKVIRHLRFNGTTISAQYEEHFQRALLTFRHQRVYDPVSQQMVHLTDVSDDVTLDLEFVGPDLPQELVKSIAEGDVDPSTNLPFEEALTAAEPSIPKYVNKVFFRQFLAKKPPEIVSQKNVVTNYFSSELTKSKNQFNAPRTILCTETETEDRPASNTLDFLVPETGDLVSVSEGIFGTPLPDDDEDTASGTSEAHNHVPGFSSQELIRRRTGVLQDTRPLEAFSFSSLSSGSPTTANLLSAKERKEDNVDAPPPLKLSAYFSRSQSARSKSSEPRRADCRSIIGTELKNADSCTIEVTKKSRIGAGEVVFETLEASSLRRGFEPHVHFNDVSYARKRPTETRCSSFENREQRSSPATIPREGGISEIGKFATNVSHVEQFANIAQKSVDKFAETIDHFRWSGRGARASGLRAPMTTISSNTSARTATQGLSTLGATLNKHAYRPSSFKPPSRTLNYSRPSVPITGAVRAQENIPALLKLP